MKRVLLTGATGYIGGRLLPELVAGGYHVRCLARRPDGLRRRVDALPAGFSAHRADYAAPGGLDLIRELRPDTVLATFTPTDRSLAGYRSGFVDGAALGPTCRADAINGLTNAPEFFGGFLAIDDGLLDFLP